MHGSRADPLSGFSTASRVACRTARPHPNMTDRPLPPVVTVATSARARRTLRFVSERQLSAHPIVGDNCERLRGFRAQPREHGRGGEFPLSGLRRPAKLPELAIIGPTAEPSKLFKFDQDAIVGGLGERALPSIRAP